MSTISRVDLGTIASAPRTSHEMARETLRYAILRGQVPGGTRLLQAEIAEQLGVSVTPVREALRDLATEGLVRLDPHRGAVVTEVSGDQLVEIVRLRQLLEVDLFRQAAGIIDSAQLAVARSAEVRLRATADPAARSVLNREFHLAIYEAAGQGRQLDMVRSLLDASMLFVHIAQQETSRRERADADHARILELVASGDVEKACTVLGDHIAIPLVD
jgi:DNA-binding GntR family transcriptional regulator